MTTNEMKTRLSERYPDAEVEVIDLTGTENHYQVLVASSNFTGKTRIQRHQDVMATFNKELKSGEVHALTIKAMTPEEKNS